MCVFVDLLRTGAVISQLKEISRCISPGQPATIFAKTSSVSLTMFCSTNPAEIQQHSSFSKDERSQH